MRHSFLLSTDIGKNIAFDGFATQSSTYEELYPPELAIDGNLHNKLHKHSCTLTLKDYEPWWKVTFKYDILVNEVIILNRAGACKL